MAGKENYTQSDRDQIERIRRLAEENDRLKAIQRQQEVDIAGIGGRKEHDGRQACP